MKSLREIGKNCKLLYTPFCRIRNGITEIRERRRKQQLRKRLQRHGLSMIRELQERLLENRIIAYPDFGTLLGIVREKQLLRHDLDIDIGIAPASVDCSDQIVEIMNGLGYQLAGYFEVDSVLKEQSYARDGIKIDFQYYCPDTDERLMSCTLFYGAYFREPVSAEGPFRQRSWMKCSKKLCPAVEKLIPFTAGGYTLRIPENYADILLYKYGENWMVPDKGWRYWEGPNTYSTEEIGFHYYR